MFWSLYVTVCFIRCLCCSCFFVGELKIGEVKSKSLRKAMNSLKLALVALSPTLKSLKLEDNELGSKAAASLGPALVSCAQLTFLQLNNNDIRGAAGAIPLLKELVAAPTPLLLLQSKSGLELNGNCFSEEELEQIKAALGPEKESCLGSLDDNDDEVDDEDDEEEEEDEEEGDEAAAVVDEEDIAGDLSAALTKLRVAVPATAPAPPAVAAAAAPPAAPAAGAGLSAQDMKRACGYVSSFVWRNSSSDIFVENLIQRYVFVYTLFSFYNSTYPCPFPPFFLLTPCIFTHSSVRYAAVDQFVASGMAVGLGTGSTAYFAVMLRLQRLFHGLEDRCPKALSMCAHLWCCQ